MSDSESETEEEVRARAERRAARKAAYPPRRFKPGNWHAESAELYKVGGFHPVQFNDLFNNRYRVFRKLGWATQSTVWLAEDELNGGYVVLKISMAKYSDHETMENTFCPSPEFADHPGVCHVSTKKDMFKFEGPNGTHLSLVSEPLGRNFESIVDNFKFNPNDAGKWSAKTGREACRQLVLGLDFLHSQKIMHRDIQPGNIMAGLSYDIDELTKDEIQETVWRDADGDKSEISGESWPEKNLRLSVKCLNVTERTDGEPLVPNDPQYTVVAVNILDKVDFEYDLDFMVKLIDLGSACKIEDCNDGKTPYPVDTRAPEIIFKQHYNEKADIWALACTMFRIVTLEPLMPIWGSSDQDATDDSCITYIIDRIGKLPEHLRVLWPRAEQHIDEDGNILEPEYKDDNFQYGDLWQGVRLAKPKEMLDEEAKVFYDLLKKMLDYDAKKRPSTREVLEHAWFRVGNDVAAL